MSRDDVGLSESGGGGGEGKGSGSAHIQGHLCVPVPSRYGRLLIHCGGGAGRRWPLPIPACLACSLFWGHSRVHALDLFA